jgi:hypothetical protein
MKIAEYHQPRELEKFEVPYFRNSSDKEIIFARENKVGKGE